MASTTAVGSRAGRDPSAASTIDAKVALSVLAAAQKGDFSARMPNAYTGSARQVANAINDVIESNQRLEREIRRRMKDEDLAALPLYPEERSCRAPSAERILAIFSPLQRHELVAGGRTIQNFQPQLSLTQQRVLRLLGLPYSIYDAS